MQQKYHRGDRVILKKKFPSYMSHFGGKGCEAIVVGSYEDQFGRSLEPEEDEECEEAEYTLLILNDPQHKRPYNCSWYGESNILKLLEKANVNTLPKNFQLLEKHAKA